MKRLYWIIPGWFALLATAQAASFDCEKAASAIEKLICGDHVLSKYDEEMNFVYNAVLEESNNADEIRLAQKQWIKERNECSDTRCLRRKYISQITLLEKTIANLPMKASRSDVNACRIVSDYSNRGALQSLFVHSSATTQPGKEEIKNIFDTDFYGDISYWFIDLNNDGISDHFVINVDGSANVSTGRVLSGKKGAAVTTVDDSLDDNLDLNLLTVEKQYYVLSGNRNRNGNDLGKLWRMGLDGYFHAVCVLAKPVYK